MNAKVVKVGLKPLAIDLFIGLGGWADGLIAEGWRVIGVDLVDMWKEFGHIRPKGIKLVLKDVLTLQGHQFKDASLIVASPPCQFFSYTSMPWSKAKKLAAEVRADPVRLEKELALFKACFRIQREASEAAGHHIPMVVENVRGAQPWVGRARWNFGSYYLWGDVPALMPITQRAVKSGRPNKLPGNNSPRRWDEREVQRLCDATKTVGHLNIRDGHTHTRHLTNQAEHNDFTRIAGRQAEARKGVGSGAEWFDQNLCKHGSKSNARKAASAMIARIPLSLARWIARVYYPKAELK